MAQSQQIVQAAAVVTCPMSSMPLVLQSRVNLLACTRDQAGMTMPGSGAAASLMTGKTFTAQLGGQYAEASSCCLTNMVFNMVQVYHSGRSQ
jgi:hypothetical protein